MLENTGHNVN